MIEQPIYPKEVAKLLGIKYRKALLLFKNEIPSILEKRCIGHNNCLKEIRYTYPSIIEKYQNQQKIELEMKFQPKNMRSYRNGGLDTRPIREFIKDTFKKNQELGNQKVT